MITIERAREIARDWHSPSPHDRNLTALSHGRDDQWTPDGLESEVIRNLYDVLDRPEWFDNPAELRDDLRLLLEFARVRGGA